MKTLFINFILLTVTLFFVSCAGSQFNVSYFGNESIIELKNGYLIESEIIYFNDTSVVFSQFPDNNYTPKKIFYLLNNEIKSITVKGFDGSGWGNSVLLFQVVPVGLLAIAASIAEVDNIAPIIIFAIPAGITALFFSGSEGITPIWNDSMEVSTMKNLSIYARYPFEIEEKEFKKVLYQNGQEKIIKFKYNLE